MALTALSAEVGKLPNAAAVDPCWGKAACSGPAPGSILGGGGGRASAQLPQCGIHESWGVIN
eukprot:15451530-Alexandrium_andersonii.AAC.1